jgi:hypothetical protein
MRKKPRMPYHSGLRALAPAIVLGGLLVFSAAPQHGLAEFKERATQPAAWVSAQSALPCPPPPPRPVPVPPGCGTRRASSLSAADVCLRLSSDPGGATAPDQIVTYQLVARNGGRGDASDVRITLPFAPEAQALLDAAFSSPGAWVSALLTDAIGLRLGTLKRDQAITATLRLRTSPNARLGRDLTTRAQVGWGDSGSGLSNRAWLVVAPAASDGMAAPLTITPSSGSPDTTFAVTYDGFASDERVSLWYQRPDGGNIGLGEVQADRQGRMDYRLVASALGAGRYTLVAAGQCSQVSAVGIFTIAGRQPTLPPAP